MENRCCEVLFVGSRASYNSASQTVANPQVFRLGIYTITPCLSIRLSFQYGLTICMTLIVIVLH